MWTLIIMFLYPHVGTVAVAEFYDKAHCLSAKQQVEASVGEFSGQLKTICVAQGE